MTARRIALVALLVAVFALLTAPAAAQPPIPDGDMEGDPILIALNSSKTVKHVEHATMQGSGTETSTCDSGPDSDHSVWFSFTMPTSGYVDVDTGGSRVRTADGDSTYVNLVVRSFTGFVEIDCVTAYGARLTDLELDPGAYRVRVANAGADPVGPSEYRLSVRARVLGELLQDDEFKTTTLGTVWQLKGAGNPPAITRTCNPSPMYCYITFTGAGKLYQTMTLPKATYKFKKGDLLIALAGINGTQPTGSDVKLTLEITYSDGTPKTKASLIVRITDTFVGPISGTAGGVIAGIASKAVKSFKLSVSAPTSGESFNMIEGSVNLYAGMSVRELPTAPQQ